MPTFLDLGIPFPLFEGPVSDASEYAGVGTCSLCGRPKQHCFDLGIGAVMIQQCPACAEPNGLDCIDREDSPCRKCGAHVPFPRLGNGPLRACYQCLRGGKVGLSKDSELGMISFDQAIEGVTHGVPGLNRTDFEMVPREDDWAGARLPTPTMLELLRTPAYSTIQGDIWQFCCKQPMVFVGAWPRAEFTRRAPDGNGRQFFESVVKHSVPGLWEDNLHDLTGIYVFRCASCGRLTGHWDIA